MAYFRCGGGGIPSSLKTDMNAVYNKKFGTSTVYDPSVWASTANLMGPLPERTASGSIAAFDDGADDVPTKSLVVTIPPTLSGVSSVSETQTGRNLLFNNIEDGTTGGIGYTKQSDGSIACSGTVSNVNATRLINTVILPIGNYVLSGADSSINLRAVLYDSEGTVITNRDDTGSGVTVSIDNTVSYIEVRIKARTNAEQVNTTISPMLAVGSTPQTYEPYNGTTYTATLGRTIYGGQADIVNGVGTDGFGIITFDGSNDENWQDYSSYNGFYIAISQMKVGTRQDGVSNYLTNSQTSAHTQDTYWLGVNSNRLFLIEVYNTMGNNTTALRSYLSEHPLTVVFPLATPTDFTFTGQEITTRLGFNAFWSEQGDTEVTYRADIDLLLGGN